MNEFWKRHKLTILFSGEALIIQIVGVPFSLNFHFWVTMDSGANLTAQYLIGRGYRPTIDFGYPYGLLPLLVERLWFSVVNPSPAACIAIVALCNLLIGCAFARLATRLNLRKVGILLIAVALPFAIQANYPTIGHAVEAAILSNALAEQAAGRRATALALAVGACFVKPTMGYVYGALLVNLAAWEVLSQQRLRLSAFYRALSPAIVTAMVLIMILGSIYGTLPLSHTLLPITGSNSYRALNYGFFRSGVPFWYFPGVRVGYYAGTVAGFWLLGTLWLTVGGGLSSYAMFHMPANDNRRLLHEIVLSCAVLQIAFVLLFFGNPFSWFYYSYILVMGVAATSILGREFWRGVCVFLLLAVLGEKTFCIGSYQRWKNTAPTPMTANLWASTEDRNEWEAARAESHAHLRPGHPAVMLEESGCAGLLFSDFAKPVSLYLVADIPTEGELARVEEQLNDASSVITVRRQELRNRFAVVHRALEGRKLIWRSETFDVYR